MNSQLNQWRDGMKNKKERIKIEVTFMHQEEKDNIVERAKKAGMTASGYIKMVLKKGEE